MTVTTNKPHDHGDRWDAADASALVDLLNTKLTYRQIGERLGRTGEATRAKARRLGLR